MATAQRYSTCLRAYFTSLQQNLREPVVPRPQSLSRCLSTVSRVFYCTVSISPTSYGSGNSKGPSSVVCRPSSPSTIAIALPTPTPTANPVRPSAGLLPSSSYLNQQTTSDLQPPSAIFPFSRFLPPSSSSSLLLRNPKEKKRTDYGTRSPNSRLPSRVRRPNAMAQQSS